MWLLCAMAGKYHIEVGRLGAPDAGDERIARERAAGEGCQQQERQPPLREIWQAHGRHRANSR
jgi:hypothetical protein